MPTLIQTLAAVLYFYFFLVASVALTVYIVSLCWRYWREKQRLEKEEKGKEP